MAIIVRSEARQLTVGDLKEGELFLLPIGDGQLLGMIGGTEEERCLVIFGSKGTNWDSQGAGWINAGGGPLRDEIAFAIPEAQLELTRGPNGYPVPTQTPGNGAIIIDEAGAAWLATRNAGSSRNFRLSDGLAGTPVGRRNFYNDWRMVWWPTGCDDAVELFANPAR